MDDKRSRDGELIETLQKINLLRARGVGENEDEVETLFDRPSTRLAIYGSLAPGEANHHVIESISGSWTNGFVRGTLRMKGWGRHTGFPGMTWIPSSEERLDVQVVSSVELPDYWDRIDRFEGRDYVRILVPVEGVGIASAVANIYQLRE